MTSPNDLSRIMDESGVPDEIKTHVYGPPDSPDSYQAFLFERATSLAPEDGDKALHIYQYLRRSFDALVWLDNNSPEPGPLKEQVIGSTEQLIEAELSEGLTREYFTAELPRTPEENHIGLRGITEAAQAMKNARRKTFLRERGRDESS